MPSELHDLLRRQASLRGDEPALVQDGHPVTWAGLLAGMEERASWLSSMGVRDGTRLGLLTRTGFAFAELFLAAMAGGATFVPLNSRLTAREIGEQSRRLALQLVAVDAALVHRAEMVSEPVVLIEVPDLGFDPEPPEYGSDAPQVVIFTSGTTGEPRPVALTEANLLASARASAGFLELTAADRWLACMPLYHVGGLGIIVRSLVSGCTVELHERFEAAAANEAVGRGDATFLSVVPTMLNRMLEQPNAHLLPGRLRCVLVGGGPVSPALVTRALDLGVPVAPTYGLTEACSQVTVLRPHEARERPSSAGLALPGVGLRVVDAGGEPVAAGETGEIEVTGAVVAAGSVGGFAAAPGGRLRTGDLGSLDREGYLYVSGRRDDLVVTGGENVMPAEVEAVLVEHPAVAECAVYGQPDPEWGQVVCAEVILAPGATATAEELAASVRARLAGYKVPRRVRFVRELPRTASGKVRRSALGRADGGA